MARKQKKKKTNKKVGDENVSGFRSSFMFDDTNDKNILEDANKIMELSGQKSIRPAIRPIIRKAFEEERKRLEKQAS